MRTKTHLLALLLISIFVSCSSENTEREMFDNPFNSDGYLANTPMEYIRLNEGSIYIMRDPINYWGEGIIEIPKRWDKVNGKSFKNIVLYDFDIQTNNNMYVKRTYKKKDYQRSEVRNFIGYVFEKTPETVKSFEGLPIFKRKEYEKVLDNVYNVNKDKINTYFILDLRTNTIYWINPYDGFSTEEKEILNWIRTIVEDISVKENCYYKRLSERRYCDCDSLRELNYIIPSQEIHN